MAGKGKWKTWTPEAILRAGFGQETATYRQIANEVEGASCSQARAARFACAAAVCKSQAESCEKVVAEASEEPLRFFIQNLMFDESTFDLRVGKDAANSCSVLCSHSQWTMGFAPSLESARDAVRDEHIVMAGQLARKLILPWQQYPWCLWPLALKDASQEDRRSCAKALLNSKPCCLDSGFSQRLKRIHRTEEELLNSQLQVFLQKVFERVVPTSTFIERRFAQFAHWSDQQPKLGTLAAKHVTSFCKGAAQAWKQNHPQHQKRNHLSRPDWVEQKQGSRTTGYNVFMSEFRKNYSAQQVAGDEGRQTFVQEATAAWRRLSPGEKAPYSFKARGLNSLRSRSSQMSDNEAGPEGRETGGLWNTCLLQDRWLLRVDLLEAAMGEGIVALRKISSAWEEARSTEPSSTINFSIFNHHQSSLPQHQKDRP